MREEKSQSKAVIVIGIVVVVVGIIGLLWAFQPPRLPMSDKMSGGFKKAAYEHWIRYHEVGGCVLPSEIAPQNTADQEVRSLFDSCFEFEGKKLSLNGKLATDDLRKQYNDWDDQESSIKSEIDKIFMANGYKDPEKIVKEELSKPHKHH